MSSPLPPEPAPQMLQVENLVTHFKTSHGTVRAVDDVTFALDRGETLALVGESGSGKSTASRTILRLVEPSAGAVWFEGRDLAGVRGRDLRTLRRKMQMIFQDPYASLDPLMRIEDILAEPLDIHRIGDSKRERRERVGTLMERVGLDADAARRYPREFSGGQRQRISIARALTVDPSLILCDEPVSALDVSIQAQILNLLRDLQRESDVAYLFISHDLSVVRAMAHRVAVMYVGKIVELADSEALFRAPRHPYTKALLSAVPSHDPAREHRRERIVLSGEPASPVNPPSGCRFRTRCWKAQEICAQVEPPLLADDRGGTVACHFPEPSPDTAAGGGHAAGGS